MPSLASLGPTFSSSFHHPPSTGRERIGTSWTFESCFNNQDALGASGRFPVARSYHWTERYVALWVTKESGLEGHSRYSGILGICINTMYFLTTATRLSKYYPVASFRVISVNSVCPSIFAAHARSSSQHLSSLIVPLTLNRSIFLLHEVNPQIQGNSPQ
jgi:hypothetical protein